MSSICGFQPRLRRSQPAQQLNKRQPNKTTSTNNKYKVLQEEEDDDMEVGDVNADIMEAVFARQEH